MDFIPKFITMAFFGYGYVHTDNIVPQKDSILFIGPTAIQLVTFRPEASESARLQQLVGLPFQVYAMD
jgi:hypothetical protein